MGARTYLPALGIFTATDPIPGGNTTVYAYPQDPINGSDLTGVCPSGRTVTLRGSISLATERVIDAEVSEVQSRVP
jgi:hypothetical protein